jgi:hypothetical protein
MQAFQSASFSWSFSFLIAQGTADELVRPSVTEAYVHALCTAGSAVQFDLLQGVGHAFVARDAASDAIAWISAGFNGGAAPKRRSSSSTRGIGAWQTGRDMLWSPHDILHQRDPPGVAVVLHTGIITGDKAQTHVKFAPGANSRFPSQMTPFFLWRASCRIQNRRDEVSGFVGIVFDIVDAASKQPMVTFGCANSTQAGSARHLMLIAIEEAKYLRISDCCSYPEVES